MDKKQIKKILKPLVKECIKEALLEDGILSGIITEVALGLSRPQMLRESHTAHKTVEHKEEQLVEKSRLAEGLRQQRIKKLNESFAGSLKGVNPFEGSTPTSAPTSPGSYSAPGALTGVEPNDPGVDIAALQALVGNKWKALGRDE